MRVPRTRAYRSKRSSAALSPHHAPLSVICATIARHSASTHHSRHTYNALPMSVSRIARFFHTPNSATLGLIALLIASFALRVYNLDWDEGRLLHPDELHVVE